MAKPPATASSTAKAKRSASETAPRARARANRAVSATITGLQAGHTYYYRIVAENENGANYGADPRVRNAAGGRSAEHRRGHEPAARRRDADGVAQARRPRSPTTTSSTARPPLRQAGPEPAAEMPRRAKKKKKSSPAACRPRSPALAEHDLSLPPRRRKQLRHHLRRRPDVHDLRARRGSQPNRRAASASTKRRCTRGSTPTSSKRATASSTAKRPPTAKKRRLGGEAIGSGLDAVARSAALSGLKVGDDLPLPRRRRKPGRHDDRTRSDLHDRSLGAGRRDLRDRRRLQRSDAARPDQPARQRHALLLPVRHRALQDQPRRLHRHPGAARRRHRRGHRRRRGRSRRSPG